MHTDSIICTLGDAYFYTGRSEKRAPVFAARCYASAAYAVMWCLSVCLSVRHLHAWQHARAQHVDNSRQCWPRRIPSNSIDRMYTYISGVSDHPAPAVRQRCYDDQRPGIRPTAAGINLVVDRRSGIANQTWQWSMVSDDRSINSGTSTWVCSTSLVVVNLVKCDVTQCHCGHTLETPLA